MRAEHYQRFSGTVEEEGEHVGAVGAGLSPALHVVFALHLYLAARGDAVFEGGELFDELVFPRDVDVAEAKSLAEAVEELGAAVGESVGIVGGKTHIDPFDSLCPHFAQPVEYARTET